MNVEEPIYELAYFRFKLVCDHRFGRRNRDMIAMDEIEMTRAVSIQILHFQKFHLCGFVSLHRNSSHLFSST